MENTPKHALITGATSGIGYELAKLFALNNYNLVLVARNQENLEITAHEMQELNPDIHTHTIAVDLFEDNAAQKVYDETKRLGIAINALVNDAGQGEWGTFAETDLDREIDIIHLNIVSLVSLTKFYLKEMLQRNEGKILQLASSVSKAPSPYLSIYAATKAFVLSFTEALIEEVKDTSVTITALQPYATDTDFFHKAKMENTVTYRESSMSTPEEVAKAGFEGLMKGEATVLPGIQNKMNNAMNVMLPDSMVAKNMAKQNEPSEKTNGRINSKHPASSRERKSIQKVNGDY
jgi:short-subunit dehydrogenase